jgi:Flp pilus assembly protein TadD
VLIAGSAVETVRAFPTYRDDERMFRTMIEREPGNAIGWVGLAGELIARGALDEASAMLDRADSVAPRLPAVALGRARVAARRDDWPAALEQAGLAAALDPSARDARLLRGMALTRLGRLAEADTLLRGLRREAPADPEIAVAWGQHLATSGRFAEAVTVLEEAATRLPAEVGLWDALGMARARLGRLEPARAAFERTVALAPGYVDGWIRLAVASHLLGDGEGRDRALARARGLPGGPERVARLALPGPATQGARDSLAIR